MKNSAGRAYPLQLARVNVESQGADYPGSSVAFWEHHMNGGTVPAPRLQISGFKWFLTINRVPPPHRRSQYRPAAFRGLSRSPGSEHRTVAEFRLRLIFCETHYDIREGRFRPKAGSME